MGLRLTEDQNNKDSPSGEEELGSGERIVAVLIALLGLLLIFGSLLWLGLSTDGGVLAAKQAFTIETAGKKTVTETSYAETLVIAALTIGAVLMLVGAFFGRIREIKFGNTGIALTEAQSKKVAQGLDAATKAASKKAPAGKQNEAAQLAIALAVPALLALVSSKETPTPVSPEVIGEAAAIKAVEDIKQAD